MKQFYSKLARKYSLTAKNQIQNYVNLQNVYRFAGRFGRVIVIPKHGSDMLSVEAWKELRTLDGIIKNATIVFGEDNMKYTYDDICARWVDHCFENDILNLDFIMPEVSDHLYTILFKKSRDRGLSSGGK